MVKKMLWSVVKIGFLLTISVAALLGVTRLIVIAVTHASIKNQTSNISPTPVAIVFGAGLTRDGLPTPVLRDRVKAAADLYFEGKVQKLLMSGDNRFENYNEPQAMWEYAIQLGVPSEDIVQDFAGRRTYDTCYRARHIFGVENAILVTQRFHLPRALYLCKNIGIQSTGYASDLRNYTRTSRAIWSIREIPATATAIFDIWVRKPIPVLGPQERISD